MASEDVVLLVSYLELIELYTYMYIYLHNIYTYLCVYIYIHIYNIYTYIYTYTHTYIYMYTFIYTLESLSQLATELGHWKLTFVGRWLCACVCVCVCMCTGGWRKGGGEVVELSFVSNILKSKVLENELIIKVPEWFWLVAWNDTFFYERYDKERLIQSEANTTYPRRFRTFST